MSDLEERDEGIDAILRASGPRLRAAMSQAHVAEFRRPRLSHGRSWVIAIASVVVLIVGLVAIGTNRNDQSQGNDPSRLYWQLTDLPADLPLVQMSEPGSQNGPPGSTAMVNVYATDAAPQGAILSVAGSNGSVGLDIVPVGGTNFRETEISGRRAAFADGATGARLLYIEVDGHFALLTSRNIDDATLSKMAESAVREPDGTVLVPEAALLDGLALVLPSDAPLSDLYMGPDFAGINYAEPHGRSISLQVHAQKPSVQAMLGLQTSLTPTKVAGVDGFAGGYPMEDSAPHVDVSILSWVRDGLAFRLTGHNVTSAEMMTAADSAEPVSDARWNEMLRQTGGVVDSRSATAETVLEGTVPAVEAPADTVPTFQGEVHDVDIEVSVVDSSVNEQVWSGRLPTGEKWKVNVSRVYDSIATRPEVDGNPQGTFYGPLGEGFNCCAPLNVITADPNATGMRVTTHTGERFSIPLHDLPGTDGFRIALVALPDGGGAELAELIDADGTVLDSLDGGN